MKNLACEPCAKRKVRCDREEPSCSNCKRRKRDSCVYPEPPTAAARIRRLEAELRRLHGQPVASDTTRSPVGLPTPNSQGGTDVQASARASDLETISFHSADNNDGRPVDTPHDDRQDGPVVLEEDGQAFHQESRNWTGDIKTSNPFTTRDNPPAFQKVLANRDEVNLSTSLPLPQHASILWTAFFERVYPFIRISFEKVLRSLEHGAISGHQPANDSDLAFLFAIYLIGALSLDDNECRHNFAQSRADVVAYFHTLCEEAVALNGLFSVTDITVLKALTLYMMAGVERLSTQSLWSLMGLILRGAERLGIHRDGEQMGLSPYETEDRRRLWWQLQHLDLVLVVSSRITSLSMSADWDTKLPLNIEDDDVTPEMTTAPLERKGLTSMSYCLFTFWVLNQQRNFLRQSTGKFQLSWQSSSKVPSTVKEDLIGTMEDGLNRNFLQYCDPIKPVHVILQLVARSLICVLRMRGLYPRAYGETRGSTLPEHTNEVVEISIQSLEYITAMHSTPLIRRYRWWIKGMFQWHALLCVLVEATQNSTSLRAQRIWELLSRLYLSNDTLLELTEDRRRMEAANLVIGAWKAREHKSGPGRCPPKPPFVQDLENRLAKSREEATRVANTERSQSALQVSGGGDATNVAYPTEQDFEAIFNLDFSDIDWSFWSSVD